MIAMDKQKRIALSATFFVLLAVSIVLIYFWGFFKFTDVKSSIITVIFFILAGFLGNEVYHWVQRGKRGESFDIIVLGFLFITVFLFTGDIFNSFIGAFSIYLIFGVMELKDYEVLNKILIITVVTYNIIFFSGLINSYLIAYGYITTEVIRDSAFAFSIWIMLILGFLLFGRKYLIVFRFLSPQYLTMFLFIISWLVVRLISIRVDITSLIYLFLIIANWIVYFSSGPILDYMLGIKPTDNKEINEMVKDVAKQIGLQGKIKVGFGQYPILNAMAYGAVFDKRIAIIAPDINTIPHDELKGIIAHELNHVKGKHTFILTLVSTIELGFLWIMKWPATYYDYVFNPSVAEKVFPIWVFILLNIGLSVFIYIFVRILEAKADLNTKKAGLANPLSKGLYNLEGFYSSGREIGLDTMLLCDDKISEYNRAANYANTAEYLNNAMINPGRLTLLSNLLNSHPPTYHRIISMYSDKDHMISPWREAILPFSLLSKKRRRKFALEYWYTRNRFDQMANEKFSAMFGISDYAEYMQKLNKKEYYQDIIGKTFLYVDNLNLEIKTGILADIQFNNDVSKPITYLFYPFETYAPSNETLTEDHFNENQFYKKKKKFPISGDSINSILGKNQVSIENAKKEMALQKIDPAFTTLISFQIGAEYVSDKNEEHKLIGIKKPNLSELENNSRDYLGLDKNYNKSLLKDYMTKYEKFTDTIEKGSYFVFADSNRNIYAKPIFDYKMKFDLESVKDAVGKDIFIEEDGTMKIIKLKEYKKGKSLYENKLVCEKDRSSKESSLTSIDNSDKDSLKGSLKDLNREFKLGQTLITKNEFSVIIHNDEETWDYERELFEYLKRKNIRCTIYLKKAVNNQETGNISEINIDQNDRKNKSELVFSNIYGLTLNLPLDKVEVIVFAEETIAIKDKGKMSFGEKIIKWIGQKRHPNKTFYP